MKVQRKVLTIEVFHEVHENGELWTRFRERDANGRTRVFAMTDFKRVDGIFGAVEMHIHKLGDQTLPF